MQYVRHYVKENKKQLTEIFTSMGNDGVIQATKVFSFLQSAFNTQQIKFLVNGTSIFTQQQTPQKMETLIQAYYIMKNQGKQTKFYMYRVNFEFKQIIQLIRFWLQQDSQIQVVYNGILKEEGQLKADIENSVTQRQLQQSSQQLKPQLSQNAQIIAKYEAEIAKYQQTIKSQPLDEGQIKMYRDKITQLLAKITFLGQRASSDKSNSLNKNSRNSINKSQMSIKREEPETQSNSVSPKRSNMSLSPAKLQNSLKAIFQFYAKQLHVTGVLASFQRIEHESSRINYQKLVHFLKQYKIFPQSSKDQKKLHQFYVKCSSSTRDLTYEGFLMLLQKLAEIIIPSENSNRNKTQLLKMKIIEQRRKNKVLNNPFHSLEKQDFRIDKASLRYQFKLMPLNGKDTEQITSELQARRVSKSYVKQQKQRTQLIKKVRYIKKLQSIDPFHPLVQKNRHLIRQKSLIESDPIVSLDNIQMYRDKNFDVKAMFGIEIDEDILGNKKSEESPPKGSLSVNNSYLVRNRVRQIEKLEIDKMKNLMSGIIERSNAKLEKLGISSTKK